MSNLDLCDLFELISVHDMTNVYMKHIYKVICNLSVYIKTFDDI